MPISTRTCPNYLLISNNGATPRKLGGNVAQWAEKRAAE
jgi:hypothetical protein